MKALQAGLCHYGKRFAVRFRRNGPFRWGPAGSDGGKSTSRLAPSLPETVDTRFYPTEPCTEPFRRSKSLKTPRRHNPDYKG
eukprot:1157940-Pelagomonas_calceolata.AAC.1